MGPFDLRFLEINEKNLFKNLKKIHEIFFTLYKKKRCEVQLEDVRDAKCPERLKTYIGVIHVNFLKYIFRETFAF